MPHPDTPALALAPAAFLVATMRRMGLRRFQITDSVGFVAVIVMPFAAFGVAAGSVAEIILPGG